MARMKTQCGPAPNNPQNGTVMLMLRPQRTGKESRSIVCYSTLLKYPTLPNSTLLHSTVVLECSLVHVVSSSLHILGAQFVPAIHVTPAGLDIAPQRAIDASQSYRIVNSDDH